MKAKAKAHRVDGDQLAYSVPDAAELVGLCRNTMWALVRAGKIRVKPVGRRVLVPRQSLLEFLAQDGDESKARSRSDVA